MSTRKRERVIEPERTTESERTRASLEPWVRRSVETLHASQKTVYWLALSEEEVTALANGVVCGRTAAQAWQALETLDDYCRRRLAAVDLESDARVDAGGQRGE